MKTKEMPVEVVDNGTTTIEIPMDTLMQPSQMISLKIGYETKEAALVMEAVKKSVSRMIKIREARINSHGEILQKEVSGTIKSFTENSFTLITREDLDGTYGEDHEKTIRIDNPLGIIPLLPSTPEDYRPFRFCPKRIKGYLEFILRVKKLAEKNISRSHSATLYYFTGEKKKEIIECEIVKANRSNLEIIQIKLTKFKEDNKIQSILLASSENPISKVKLHITPSRYLYKIRISTGQRHVFSGFDDYEEN